MLSISGTSKGSADASTSFCVGSGVLADATSPGGGFSRGAGEAASTIPLSGPEATPTVAVARGVLTTIRDPPDSMPREPRPTSPAATQPLRMSVPHSTANTAYRCGLIAPPPATSSKAPRKPSQTGTRRISFSDQSVVARRTKTTSCHHSPDVLPDTTRAREYG